MLHKCVSLENGVFCLRLRTEALIDFLVKRLDAVGIEYLTCHLDNLLATKYSHLPPDDARRIIDYFISHIHTPDVQSVKWHQYSIQGHSAKTVAAFRNWLQRSDALQEQLISPSLRSAMYSTLRETIGEFPRYELLGVAMALHDVGKYIPVVRGTSIHQYRFRHGGHEEQSKKMILDRNGAIHTSLVELGYTRNQIDYIADLAGLHFELGLVREDAVDGTGYNLAFVTSPACRRAFLRILENPCKRAYRFEIGLMFLWDTLSKTVIPPTDIFPYATITHDSQRPPDKVIRSLMSNHGVSEHLFRLVSGIPVSVVLAREYFSWLEEAAPEEVPYSL